MNNGTLHLLTQNQITGNRSQDVKLLIIPFNDVKNFIRSIVIKKKCFETLMVSYMSCKNQMK